MSREAVIRRVSPYELHGVRYYQLFLSYLDAPEHVQEVRLAHDVVYASPGEGDLVMVETLLSMVTEVRKKDG